MTECTLLFGGDRFVTKYDREFSLENPVCQTEKQLKDFFSQKLEVFRFTISD